MTDYVISPAAQADIISILDWTEERFGVQGRMRYEALLSQAILDVADDPQRVGSLMRREIIETARTYHLSHSRDRVGASMGKVRHPRHFLLYRKLAGNRIEIGRILHDSMDISRNLPCEYQLTHSEEGISLHGAVVIPVEVYSAERKAEFLLNSAVDAEDYRRVMEEVRKLGLDPDKIAHEPLRED